MKQWEKNIKALAEKNEKLAEEIRKIIEEEQHTNVLVKELENGSRILGINHNNRIWYLNSRLDPEGAAELYTDRYEIKPFYRYFVFGFSDGRVVRKLLEKCDGSNAIIICEPNKEIFAKAIEQYDLEELLSDKRVLPCILEYWKTMTEIVFATVEYSYIKLIEFCILPGYDVLYTEECQKFMDEVLERMKLEIIEQGTYIHFGRKMPQNILFNTRNMIGQRNVVQLKTALERLNIESIPAIIISAGPSLDKNIQEVKSAEGKAFILVVDAALKTAIREGIRPNMVCSIDANAPERFFEGAETQEFIWSCNKTTNPWLLKKYGKRVFYHNRFFGWWDDIVQEELGYTLPQLKTGGSVSTEAFELARYLGFKTIILIGQDLAFTGGQSHTSGIKGVLGDNDEYIRNRTIVQVEDAEGNILDTDFQMNEYRLWFEREIEENKDDLHVIDATEGGAKIHGAIIQPLKEAIQQECKREGNFYEIVRNTSPAFSEEQQENLYQRLKEFCREKEEFKKILEEGILEEEELLKSLKEGKITEKAVSDGLERIIVLNAKLEQHIFMECISLYATKEEVEMQGEICAKEDMEVEEVIERSIRLHRSYLDAIPLFEEDFAEALNG